MQKKKIWGKPFKYLDKWGTLANFILWTFISNRIIILIMIKK